MHALTAAILLPADSTVWASLCHLSDSSHLATVDVEIFAGGCVVLSCLIAFIPFEAMDEASIEGAFDAGHLWISGSWEMDLAGVTVGVFAPAEVGQVSEVGGDSKLIVAAGYISSRDCFCLREAKANARWKLTRSKTLQSNIF